LQFTTAMVVFIAALVIGQQINFFFKGSLGYDKEYLVTAALPRNWTTEGIQKMETVRNELARLPAVAGASFAYEIPNGNSGHGGQLYKPAQDSSTGVVASGMATDEYFATTYKVPMVAGKYLTTEGNQYDPSLIVINESAARALGWKQPAAAMGQPIRITNAPFTFTIGGVIKDFHFTSMHNAMQPFFFVHVRNTNTYRYMALKLKPGNMDASLQSLQKKWAMLMPGAPFEYNFIDDTLATLYKSEIQMRKAAEAATAIALVIVLSGVIGIISLSLARRRKELGIRKVLGASVLQMIALFIKEFAWVIMIAAAIACPVAYFLLHKWLMNFAYHINIGLMPFIIVAGCIMVLTGLVITIQTIQKAWMSPVKSLRTE
jgi:putative ABC transport system permease protein